MKERAERTALMTVCAARRLRDADVCFVGIGIPSTAANLARRLHAPNACLIYESGTIGAKPMRVPVSIADAELARTADCVVSTPEIFRYWLQGGRIDVGFLGAAQIDRFANINTTVIGAYDQPTVRLPGAGGAPEIAALAREVLIVLKHDRRAFVERLDFITSPGFLTGGDARQRSGLTTSGPTAVVTDLCVLEPDPEDRELRVTSLHPGVSFEEVQAATGWPLRTAREVQITEAVTPAERDAMGALLEAAV